MAIVRSGTAASRESLVALMLQTRQRLNDTQTQVSTEKKSQDYKGLDKDVARLLSLEAERARLQAFRDQNVVAETRVAAQETASVAMERQVRDFRNLLLDFNSKDLTPPITPDTTQATNEIQRAAFYALKAMEYFMNTQVEGRYIFAGGETNAPAANVPFGNLAEFQAAYDGINVRYPTNRTDHVSAARATGAEAGTFTFGPGNTINTANAVLADFQVGSVIRVSGSTSNNGYFEVTAVAGNQLTVQPAIVAEVASNTETVEAAGYYKGDTLQLQHRVDERETLDLLLNGKDPAFEKAMRAMGLIAQGDILNNLPRINQAITLLNDSLQHDPASGEQASDFTVVNRTLGFNRATLNQAQDRTLELDNLLSQRIGKIENVDLAEAVVRLQDDATVLEVSLQSLARFTQLSLAQFL